MALDSINISVGAVPAKYTASFGELVLDKTDAAAAVVAAKEVAAGNHDSTTEIDTISAAITAMEVTLSGDIAIVWNTSTVTTLEQFRQGIRKAMLRIEAQFK